MERLSGTIKQDHEALEAEAGALKSVLAAEEAEEARRAALKQFIRIMGPDLELHLRKEEEVLFPALQRLSGERAAAIGLLKEQHGQLRWLLRRLAGLVCECDRASGAADWRAIAETSQQFIGLLEDHEGKEEQLLIHALEERLEPQELIHLARAFQRVTWSAFREGF